METFQIILIVVSIIGLIWSSGLALYSIAKKDFYQMSGGAFFVSVFVLIYSIIIFIAGVFYGNSTFKSMSVMGFVLSLIIMTLSLIIQRDYDLKSKRFVVEHNLSCWITLGISSVYAVVFEFLTLLQLLNIKVI